MSMIARLVSWLRATGRRADFERAMQDEMRAHLDTQGFGDVKVNFLGGEAPARTDPDHPFVKLVDAAAEPIYGSRMMMLPMVGGSGPNHAFVHDLGLPVCGAGLGHPDTRAHAPNENIRVDLYLKHAQHVVRILEAFAAAKP